VQRTPVLDLFRPAVHGLARAWFRLELRGTENIPRSGGLIITPNHQTYADPPLVTIPVRRRVYYMAWNKLFDIPVLGQAIRLLRAFPVDIYAKNDPRAVREAHRLIRDGAAVMIFPEGGRSTDGTLGHFKLGAFRLAVTLGATVLPVTITGGHEAWPPQRALPRRGRVTITYHPPLQAAAGAEPRAAARDLAERARAAIAGALTHQRLQAPRSSTR
jgi:1-acyl-sn-glycerol-3-phosphate acyltransferase